ncbi:unnamed protein product, partial [Adineta ricciae]
MRESSKLRWVILIIIFLFLYVTVLHLRLIYNYESSGELPITDICQELPNGVHLCYCGVDRLKYDRLKGESCVDGKIIRDVTDNFFSSQSDHSILRSAMRIFRSTREDNPTASVVALRKQNSEEYVALKNVSVEARIHWYAADVTLTHVYVNREENPIEAIYVFPIEESAAIYEFTAEIDNRIIRALLKEKQVAKEQYRQAVKQGKTAVLFQQSSSTLDTFQMSVGNIPAGKECIVRIRYVTELDLFDGKSIRFVIPTTISPRYNPKIGGMESPNNLPGTKYVQNTPYSMLFRAQIDRGDGDDRINHIANRSHPVNVSASKQMIEVTSEGIALDRDIILDIDLPTSRSEVLFAVEQWDNSRRRAVLMAITPNTTYSSTKSHEKKDKITMNEFIFIVDCSGSMEDEQKIGLARQAMILFVRGLPVNSQFNIIRFGSTFDVLFKTEKITVAYHKDTVQKAVDLSQLMMANLGGTELLQPLKYLASHPPIDGRFRNVFLLTDGEVANTDEVIQLCASMSSTTRIFSFGLGYSPSRALVKGLAQATNGASIFVPPNSPVDEYV